MDRAPKQGDRYLTHTKQDYEDADISEYNRLPSIGYLASSGTIGSRKKTHKLRSFMMNIPVDPPTCKPGQETWPIAGSRQKSQGYAPESRTEVAPTYAP